MEGLIVAIVSLLGLAVFAGPILSVLGFVRSRDTRAKLVELTRTVELLERRVQALSAHHDTAAMSAAPPPVPGPASPALTPAVPVPVRPTPPAAAQVPPIPPMPAPSSSPARQPPPATAPPLPPPVPSSASPRADVPAPVREPAFDWESMLGVRGAAWLGGITLVIAAAFFAKWGIDQGFFSPSIRIALMIVAGASGVVWAELQLRQGFQPTANAVSGAGVVTLYLALFAGHSLYQLFGVSVTFVAMSVVTALAATIAVRHAALFTAGIGLVGGLATPVLLSTGVDRPVAFFSYLVVLAVGFLHVAARRQWPVITVLSVVGTSLLQLGWYTTYLAPEKLLVGIVAFAALGIAYLWHAVRVNSATEALSHSAATVGAIAPLAFVAMIAADTRFAPQWSWVTADLTVLGMVLVWAGVRWTQPLLVTASAVATGLAMAAQAAAFDGPVTASWGLAACAMALTASYNLLPRWAARTGATWLMDPQPAAGVVGFAPTAGLVAFTWVLAASAPSTWLFVALLSVILGCLHERTRDRAWPGALTAGALLVALVCARWFSAAARPDGYVIPLAIAHLWAAAVTGLVVRRAPDHGAIPPREWWQRDPTAVLAAVGVAYLGLFECVDRVAFAAPAPLFVLLGFDIVLVLLVVIRFGWTGPVPAAAAAALAFGAAWQHNLMRFDPAPTVVAYTSIYLLFMALPFVMVRRLAPWWSARPLPWVTAALTGPAMFPLFYDTWSSVAGKQWIGALPMLMAGASAAALYGASRHFAPGDDTVSAQRRLNYLALFAAVALGFVAAAVPIQVDRQWITLAWALEAAAVWWLFGRLPHPGLKYLGWALFGAVGVRLLANPDVLRYEPRGRAIVNWLLYTYGVPALACLVGAFWLRGAETRRDSAPASDYLPGDRALPQASVAFLGLLLIFWLINLEIADFYSAGRYVELDLTRHLQRDLTRSCAWGLYAITLLVIGLWRGQRSLRVVSLGFLMLTAGKVFVYDLGQLTGLYRIVSFMALGVSLILVSLLYQRFVRSQEPAR